MRESKPDWARQMGRMALKQLLLRVGHLSPLFMTAYVALYVSE